MAAVGSNNVYVDIIFRLQAEAAKRAERIIRNLIKKGEFATLTLKQLGIPPGFPKTTLQATTQIFRLAQGADTARRANSALLQRAIAPLIKDFRAEAKALKSLSEQYLQLASASWKSLSSQDAGRRLIRQLGLTEQNYSEILSSVGQAYADQAARYYAYIKRLKEGQLIHKEELIRLKEAWNIYKATGIRLECLRDNSIALGKQWESLIPLSERAWKPTAEQIRILASGLSTLDQAAAMDMMTMARHAAVARAFNEPIANIDENAYRLLRNFDEINARLARMGILFPITTESARALARGQAEISEETLTQARAFARSAANLEMLGVSARGNIALGSQLYDIFTDNSRMALQLEESVRGATGILDYHSRGLHLVNRALRAQNANFEINYNTLKRITEEGWAAFTEEQRKALLAIRDAYQAERRLVGALQPHQRALLQLIEATEEYDRALHFQLRTAGDAEFLLKRLRTVGYEGLTEAEKRAISELERNISLTWTWDARTKTLAQRIIALKNAYTEQGTILRELTPRQRAFYGAIYRLQTGMGRLSRFIDRVSIGSLKLLGPIFLATAAINTFGRIIGTCVESFTNYETALMDLRVAGGLTIETANRLSQAFISLERILPISATQMLGIARAAAKAGITGEVELKRFTLALTKFTQVTGWSAEEASEALLKISRAFRVPIENAEYLASMMHYLAVVSVADADDIVNALSRVGAAAVNLGITADEAAAMATTLIDAGMGAERAGTRLRAFLREFLEKSEKIVAVMENAGEEFQNFGDTIRENPAEALKEFLRYLSNINDEAERARIVYEIFGSVAGFAVLTLAEHYPLLEERMEAAYREMIYGTRLSKDFSKWMDATSVSLKKASNSFDRLKRSIGAALAPAVETLSNWFTGLIEHIFPETREGIK
ncbi:MAG: phage tail tape measure protein, partial [Candidatus Aenigmatarchaeota archaeon]